MLGTRIDRCTWYAGARSADLLSQATASRQLLDSLRVMHPGAFVPVRSRPGPAGRRGHRAGVVQAGPKRCTRVGLPRWLPCQTPVVAQLRLGETDRPLPLPHRQLWQRPLDGMWAELVITLVVGVVRADRAPLVAAGRVRPTRGTNPPRSHRRGPLRWKKSYLGPA
jgi:hypothetical protein